MEYFHYVLKSKKVATIAILAEESCSSLSEQLSTTVKRLLEPKQNRELKLRRVATEYQSGSNG